jgi:hypothetical protein
LRGLASTRGLIAVAACLIASCAGTKQAGTFRVPADPDYAHARDSLAELVAERGKQPVNHFCIIGYKPPDGEPNVWVHWVEENRLILWEPYTADAGADRKKDMLRSRRNLDLANDVVASGSDLQGSTYRVTRAWVDKTLADCETAGTKYTIRKQR